ncbi:GTP-binding protein [Saccharothrix obliqua]|uniref:GTP-binding protein n=1 Tax=Saccharothrix obliqua TaxID=2861747 RepID=UPI001C5DB9DC|nr:GTP-binding protein [Saccharothrix obliqua]MBW4718730.1 hypothetical protein [Saccharothrix obliqua]
MRFVPLGGFLGAGKTTTMIAAGRRFEGAGSTVSVITNDQGVDLVDTSLAAASLGDVSEVTGGCFCCKFEDLAAVVTRLTSDAHPDVVLAEAVGSCTDLQSTVIRPLRHFYGDDLHVAPLTVLVDPVRYAGLSPLWDDPATEPDLAYLFRHQLDEADIIAINKADLLSPVEVGRVRDQVQVRFPHARVVAFSAATGAGLDELVALWATSGSGEHRPFAVDYRRYGAAEAELAWTNQSLSLRSATTFAPAEWVRHLLAELGSAAARAGMTVGHVKVRVTSPDGTTKASLTGAGAEPTFDEQLWVPTRTAEVVLNARVRTSPDDLDTLIGRCLAAADAATGADSGTRAGDVFRPGFPEPVHRM